MEKYIYYFYKNGNEKLWPLLKKAPCHIKALITLMFIDLAVLITLTLINENLAWIPAIIEVGIVVILYFVDEKRNIVNAEIDLDNYIQDFNTFANRLTDKGLYNIEFIKTIKKRYEKKINEKLFNQAIQDGRYMALILAKDAGLNNTQMSKLQWKDIIFDNEEEDYVRICMEKVIAEQKKVFVRPCFSLCARALRQRYKKLLETETVKKLAKHYVVSEDGKEMPVQKLNSFIRETLARLGISNRVLAALHAETPQISAGAQLLLNTYKHKVEEMCALEKIDPAAIKFLQSLSFGRDTTANHYHDYMSKDGQWKLYIAMRRLDSFLKTNSREPCVKRSKPDGMNGKRTTSVSLESVTRCLQGKIEVELNPGEIIVIEGRYGVKGEARIMEAGQKSDKEIVYEEVSYFDLIQVNP